MGIFLMFKEFFKTVRRVFRSAITGRFVSKKFAEENPDTTISHNITVANAEDFKIKNRLP
jgi:hypothetical protein